MHESRLATEEGSDLLRVQVRERVATLTLNRPAKRNALSLELRARLTEALVDAAQDDGVACTVLTGAGSAFCAGMDRTQFGGDIDNRRALVETTERLFGALIEHPKPVIAAVNGPALGGGFALALLSDIRVAGPSASFGFPELRLGIPGSYGAARAALPRPVALDLCMSGRTIDAAEALRLGVVSEVAEGPSALERALERAGEIASLPDAGPRMVKQWASEDRSWARLLELELDAFRSAALGQRG
jgi:enoyl-CoA hydratase